VQVEGTIKVGSCHPWVHQRSGRLMCGDRYQEPSSLKEARAGTVNDCMFPTALMAQEKQRSFWSNREGRCKGVHLNGAWDGNGVAPGVAPNPTVGTSEGEALGNYLLQLARRHRVAPIADSLSVRPYRSPRHSSAPPPGATGRDRC
jgi:hypothetical protein